MSGWPAGSGRRRARGSRCTPGHLCFVDERSRRLFSGDHVLPRITMRGQPVTVMGFTVAGGRIVEIDAIADAERVPRITAAVPGDG